MGGRQHERRACRCYKATACEDSSGEPYIGIPEVRESAPDALLSPYVLSDFGVLACRISSSTSRAI
jgi:hypothetical protein